MKQHANWYFLLTAANTIFYSRIWRITRSTERTVYRKDRKCKSREFIEATFIAISGRNGNLICNLRAKPKSIAVWSARPSAVWHKQSEFIEIGFIFKDHHRRAAGVPHRERMQEQQRRW